jgi:hypothetical protein
MQLRDRVVGALNEDEILKLALPSMVNGVSQCVTG